MDRRGELLLGIFGVIAGVVIVVGFAHWRANYYRHEEVRRAERALANETRNEVWKAVASYMESDVSEAFLDRVEREAVERVARSKGMTVRELRALWARTGTRPMTVKEWRAWQDLLFRAIR